MLDLLEKKKLSQAQMLECIDHTHTELQTRLKAIKEVAAMFESVILCATLEELNISVPKLTNFYDEISKDNFY